MCDGRLSLANRKRCRLRRVGRKLITVCCACILLWGLGEVPHLLTRSHRHVNPLRPENERDDVVYSEIALSGLEGGGHPLREFDVALDD